MTQSCGCYRLEQIKKLNSGENNNLWRGGKFKQPYSDEWTDELKEQIRNRDQRKCQFQDCNYDDTKEFEKLHVHHIDSNKQNCEEYNLISLCRQHHMTIENNHPELWQYDLYQITGDYR